ncbi:MAG TPA: hypothetical protein VNO30_13540 [Kofleriaceae bacterium]|nr:hypothetical protein [Kofleriaceae bacterium]
MTATATVTVTATATATATKRAPGTAFAVAFAVAAAAGCAGTQRSPQAYRADTERVLETRTAEIRRCYDRVLASEAGGTAGGTVTVRFVVEKKTGAFMQPTVDPGASNASEPLVLCVLEALRGLKLEPPDRNEGQATFRYDLAPATASK